MCGDVIVRWKTVPDPDHLGQVMRIGTEERVLAFSYSKIPVLPVTQNDGVHLLVWGNRDRNNSALPHTGWCRKESLDAGKWNWLHPELIEIPAIGGVEKGKWLAFSGPLAGVQVYDEQKLPHAYMLTQQADEAYAAYTHHDRMPVIAGGWTEMATPEVLETGPQLSAF